MPILCAIALGLVPKSNDKTWLIFHLSYDFKDSGQTSLNANTPEQKCHVKYKDLDHAIAVSLELLKNTNEMESQCPYSIAKQT